MEQEKYSDSREGRAFVTPQFERRRSFSQSHNASPSHSIASVRFRRFHAKEILTQFDMSRGPLDLFISLAFRKTAQLGSKDRAWISETIYTYFRMKSLLNYILEHRKGLRCDENSPTYWDALFDLIDTPQFLDSAIVDPSIPEDIRLSLPMDLYEALLASWKEEFFPLALSLNKSAPLTIRVNTMKTTRDALLNKFIEYGFQVEVDAKVSEAIHFGKRMNLFTLPEFKEGFFEVQDAGSQIVASMVEALPKQHFLDYCSGSGGKSLAVAPRMKGEGQIYLHDIRDEALLSAKKRLARASIQNVQLIRNNERAKLSKLKGKMDWVLVDAPCSGTGTLRRNPDMKWKFSLELVERLQETQKEIVREAVQFLKPGGRLVYATCSLLEEENEAVVAFMEKELSLEIDRASENYKSPYICKTAPHTGVWDGFFAVRMKRKILGD